MSSNSLTVTCKSVIIMLLHLLTFQIKSLFFVQLTLQWLFAPNMYVVVLFYFVFWSELA